MNNTKIFKENGYKWSCEKTDDTPYYYDTKYEGRIWCDYKLFRMLRSIDEKDFKRQDEESRCVVLNKKGLPVKCRLNCSKECPYGSNHYRNGYPISIESLQESNSHVDFIDYDSDPRDILEFEELKCKLKEIINGLSPKDRFIYISLKIKDKTEREIANKLGISQPAVHKRVLKISKLIEEKMQNFIN